jgi:hypothetical protein
VLEKVILRRAVESVILSRIGERCVFALLWSFRVSVDLGGCRSLKGEVEGAEAMAGERKRKLSLFDVVDETANGAEKTKVNGGPVLNPYTNRPYSAKYFEILEKRRTLPVWQQKAEFLNILAKNQTMILVGETGSGKTTQVR